MSDAPPQQNGLANAASAYLRAAQRQPVDWHPWGTDAFARAQRENKPILLDIGATWCQWCGIMSRESYADPATAAIINDHYIAIKVDRDERPDIDARYQAAVAAISGQGGWPLTVLLTSDGKPYFGGGYFPLIERHGQPSFHRVLLTMAHAFANSRAEVEESAASVMQSIEESETFAGYSGTADAALLDKIIAASLAQFDERNGGFGSQPKFPHPTVLDLLLGEAASDSINATRAKHAATVTLDKMAAGGIYDQLAGGFHRYSIDERWRVPRFEKMAYDNSALLQTYLRAYEATSEKRYAHIAKDILGWMDAHLSDRDRGGFYASQTADATPEDDGSYYTWTRAETASVLSPEEFAAAESFYGLRAVGDMQLNPQKNVLHRAHTAEAIATQQQRSLQEVAALLRSARSKLLNARLARPTPPVDRAVYTGLNAMCISAYLLAGRVLQLPETTAFALKSLDRILSTAWSAEGLSHVVTTAGPRIAASLDEYAALCIAAIDAWESTHEPRYQAAAQQIANAMLDRFCDFTGDGASCRGFFDTESATRPLGALSAKRKPIQDSPAPSGNALAATALLRLHVLTGEPRYRKLALDTLETFAGVVEHLGLQAAGYALALRLALGSAATTR